MKSELPKRIRRIYRPKTGKVTFEACAGVVHGEKIRKQFGEATYGTQDAALEAAVSWCSEKREEIIHGRKNFETVRVQELTETLEAAIKLSEQRIIESFELILKRQSKERETLLARIAWLFSLSVEYGKNPLELLENFLNDGLKGLR